MGFAALDSREQLRRLLTPPGHAVLRSPNREPRPRLAQLPQQARIHRPRGPSRTTGGPRRVSLEHLADALHGCAPVPHLRVSASPTMVAALLRLASPRAPRTSRPARPRTSRRSHRHRIDGFEPARREAPLANRAERLVLRAVRQNQARAVDRHVDVLELRASTGCRRRGGSLAAPRGAPSCSTSSRTPPAAPATSGTPQPASRRAPERPVLPREPNVGSA
jgi:hypothetical protein